MIEDQDKLLLKKVKKDPQAFALIYDQYYKAIFSYTLRRVADYDLAKDITAETFLKAFQKIGSFEWRNIPISSWLYRIATNEINLYFRASRYKPESLDEIRLSIAIPYEEGIETEKAAMEKNLQEHAEFARIQKQLILLPVKYQEVIALRFFEEKSIIEISEILHKKEGTIKSLISRGLEKLRTAIG